MKAILVFSSIYVLLFVLHIVFAANDLEHLFRIVATLLVAMTFFCAPILWLIDSTIKQSSRTGYIASIPLSIGIAYAYTNKQQSHGFTSVMELIKVDSLEPSGRFDT